jgi:hypothetical protein
MKHVARLDLEPAHGLDCRISPDNAEVARSVAFPRIGRRARACALHAARHRKDGEDHVTIGQQEVMHECAVWRVEERLASQGAVSADDDEAHASAKQAASRVGVSDHVAHDGIDLGMRREPALDRPWQSPPKS